MKLDRYTLVFLRRPPDAPQLPEDELESLQRGHLEFLAGMRKSGRALTNGPLLEQPDPALRGLVVYRTSIDEAIELSAGDPLIRAGRLVAEAITWLVPVGTLGDKPAATVEV